MINLLASERKDEIKAARVNVVLIRYMSIVMLAFLFIAGALIVSHSVLKGTMASAENRISANDIKADVYSDTRQQVSSLGAKLNDAKIILDQEVRYSKVLVQIGQLTPPGVVLGDLTLDTASFNGQPVEIKAYTKTTNEAGLLQSNFQSSAMFSSVELKSTEPNQEVDGYPVTTLLTVTLNRAGI